MFIPSAEKNNPPISRSLAGSDSVRCRITEAVQPEFGRPGRARHRAAARGWARRSRANSRRAALAGLLLTGRNRERGEAVAASLQAQGCDARFHAADLADMAGVAGIVPAAEAAFGRLDILVNAAGDTDRGTIFDTSPNSTSGSWRSICARRSS